ncbi:imelysin family protein [Leisingera sp. XS_AS12]|uniref:imelysin family protein n=1 Tax=Leisingera sp. XS_AS12 TaxID=3241294 RepID=UPI0035149968
MRSIAFALTLLAAPAAASELTTHITDQHILPAFQALAQSSSALAQTAQKECDAQSPDLRAAFGEAFDSWIAASHYRFGPTETDNRAFALAFWPDSRGKTPKALAKLIHKEDATVSDPDSFASYTIAARGFYALEYLLYDPEVSTAGQPAYRCTLTRAISHDIAATAAAILTDWQQTYAAEMRSPGNRYQSDEEIAQELFKALNTGLQVMDDLRLGRPLGTFDRPRPLRAEARRSGRSLRHLLVSLNALEPLALALAEADNATDPSLKAELTQSFAKIRDRAEAVEDPTFASVADPAGRIRIEALRQDVQDLRALVATRLGPVLGVAAGFNALDGD